MVFKLLDLTSWQPTRSKEDIKPISEDENGGFANFISLFYVF